MSDSEAAVQRWREKYLSSLEARETLENDFLDKVDQLRKGMLLLILACKGLDTKLDDDLQPLATSLKGESLNLDIHKQIKAVQRSAGPVIEQDHLAALQDNLAKLYKQLHRSGVSSELQGKLKRKEKQLSEHLDSFVSVNDVLIEMHSKQQAVLDELKQSKDAIQAEALTGQSQAQDAIKPSAPSDITTQDALVSEEPSPSLWKRMFSRRSDKPTEVDATLEASAEESFEISSAEPIPAIAEDEVPALTEQDQDPSQEETAKPQSRAGRYQFGQLSDDQLLEKAQLDQVLERCSEVLKDFLERLQVPDTVSTEATSLRESMQRGLNWFELQPSMETLSHLSLTIIKQNQEGFEGYLGQVHQRLNDVQKHMSAVSENQQQSFASAQQYNQNMLSNMGGLQQVVNDASDLDSLKEEVGSQLEHILHEVEEQQQEHALQDETQQQLVLMSERLEALDAETETLKKDLQQERARATTDALTGLPNRQAFDDRAVVEVARWKRYKEPLCVAIADIDLFKQVNDTYGHLAGDKLLRIIAKQLRTSLREVDFIARYGGEEFVMLLPNTRAVDALVVMEKVRAAIEQSPFHFQNKKLVITSSFGLSEFVEEDDMGSAFDRADKALYQAKDTGRNKICSA